ncbi:hypothetical protein PAT3040_02567 [Paenibacillus agaridevorans]|uniref:Uncharacterized protein n=1 Tax=Paenibacillus agaridevorans TaxID=171404 RepID=A0A2R5EMV8_9BACL|nr:hypothetical protein [Paenibacillus agaridevorans]GBG08000.1 hypothetical protein PAT3040_02567 [Paenibacillus agaridevorans]
MDKNERKTRLQTLLERQKLKNQMKDTSKLFDECIVTLGDGIFVFSKEKSTEIYKTFENEYKFTFYGRVEWNLYECEEIDLSTLKTQYAKTDETCFILWSHGSDPVIKAKINNVLEHIDIVMAVSPDVWLYRNNEYVIEIFHDGIIRTNNMKE